MPARSPFLASFYRPRRICPPISSSASSARRARVERVERVEHDSLLDPAQEVLGRRAPLVFNLNVEQTTEMVVEAVTPAALGDVERRL